MGSTFSVSFLFLFLLMRGGSSVETHYTTYEAAIPPALQAWFDEHKPGTDLRTSRVELKADASIEPPDTRFSSSLILIGSGPIAHKPVRKTQEDSQDDTQTPDVDETPQVTQDDTAPASNEVQQLKDENAELKARLDRLEKLLGAKTAETPADDTATKSDTTTVADATKKTLPGWLAELHPWRVDGRLSDDAESTMVVENCDFNGTLGQSHKGDMHVYRFQAVFHNDEPGRYAFAMDTTCGLNHACNMFLKVDDDELFRFSGRAENERLLGGLALEPGNHRIAFLTWLPKDKFMKFQPATRYRWHPLVKGPSDINFRDFNRDELFVQVPKSSHMTAKKC